MKKEETFDDLEFVLQEDNTIDLHLRKNLSDGSIDLVVYKDVKEISNLPEKEIKNESSKIYGQQVKIIF